MTRAKLVTGDAIIHTHPSWGRQVVDQTELFIMLGHYSQARNMHNTKRGDENGPAVSPPAHIEVANALFFKADG